MERFEGDESLGEGTFGVVVKAKDRETGRMVALKHIRPDPDSPEKSGLNNTTLREISLLKKLKHKNIIELYEVLNENGVMTLVFELMETDLKRYTDEHNNGLPTYQIKSFLRQLLSGVQYIHRAQIIHRDLKPQNLLINDKLELKIGDFGLARACAIPVRSYTNEVITLWYRPPDVLLGQTQYSTPVDMWSVGCIFAEMITGSALFRGRSEEGQLEAIFKKLGPPTEDNLPGVTSLELWNDRYSNIEKTRPRLSKMMESLDANGWNLLLNLLAYDPNRRISARRALEHKYFKDDRTARMLEV